MKPDALVCAAAVVANVVPDLGLLRTVCLIGFVGGLVLLCVLVLIGIHQRGSMRDEE